MPLNTVFCLENCQWNCSLSDWWSFRFARNDKATAEALVFDHLIAKKFSQPLCSADWRRLLSFIFLQLSRHASVLTDQFKEFTVWHVCCLKQEKKVNLLSEYNKPSLADPGTKKLPWRGGCTGVDFKESQRRRLICCCNHVNLCESECSFQAGVRLTEEFVARVECNKQFGTCAVRPCLSPATFLFCQTKIVDFWPARHPSNIKKGSWVHWRHFNLRNGSNS